MKTTLATFRADKNKWIAFIKKCKSIDRSAGQVLRGWIDEFLQGKKS